MDSDIEKEQQLRDICYNPKTGYQSAERLSKNLNVSRQQIKEYLKS